MVARVKVEAGAGMANLKSLFSSSLIPCNLPFFFNSLSLPSLARSNPTRGGSDRSPRLSSSDCYGPEWLATLIQRLTFNVGFSPNMNGPMDWESEQNRRTPFVYPHRSPTLLPMLPRLVHPSCLTPSLNRNRRVFNFSSERATSVRKQGVNVGMARFYSWGLANCHKHRQIHHRR
jgi:hypothetical protein